jgi:hypothetical protein
MVADTSLLPGWQAFIAGTSFGAGYTTLFCVSITTSYETQDWYVAVASTISGRFLTFVQACDPDDHSRCSASDRVQHIRRKKIADV